MTMKFKAEYKVNLPENRAHQIWTLKYDNGEEMLNFIKNDELFREIDKNGGIINVHKDLDLELDTYQIEYIDWNHKALVIKTIKDPFEDMR